MSKHENEGQPVLLPLLLRLFGLDYAQTVTSLRQELALVSEGRVAAQEELARVQVRLAHADKVLVQAEKQLTEMSELVTQANKQLAILSEQRDKLNRENAELHKAVLAYDIAVTKLEAEVSLLQRRKQTWKISE